MNAGQEKFSKFIMDHVKEESNEKALELLKEGFAKQEDKTFNQAYLETFIPKMLEFIKEESMEKVKRIMQDFKASF